MAELQDKISIGLNYPKRPWGEMGKGPLFVITQNVLEAKWVKEIQFG